MERAPNVKLDSRRAIMVRSVAVQPRIAPDAATCPDCLAEIFDSDDRRFGYPFGGCARCGPRLSLVESCADTSMADFELCPACRSEYENSAGRRFHAPPDACPICGPKVWLERMSDLEPRPLTKSDPIGFAARLLDEGSILAIKGMGGFHLACDASRDQAVRRLRVCRKRYGRPLALMARDVDVIRRYCSVSESEATLLASPAAPVVILSAVGPERVSNAVAPGQRTLGFMLPHTPLHHLLLRRFDRPLVMTSGALSDEPQCIDNAQARRVLSPVAEYGLFHDRRTVNGLDDSVARVVSGRPRLLRRARGYAPAPIRLPEGFENAPPLLAFGGQLKNTFCLTKDGQAILSQHIGDLDNALAFQEYRQALTLYGSLLDHKPQAVVVDMHPASISTQYAREWAAHRHCRIEETQHHHAHIAGCLAENGVPLGAPPVLGIALDGLGYGPDGALWGGEFLLAGYAGFERLGGFPPVALPGGAQAATQPWRNTFAHLDAALGWDHCKRRFGRLELIDLLNRKPIDTIRAMLRNRVNSPLASSCGLLFDAVAGAIGVCFEQTSYDGQAAAELESCVDERSLREGERYPISIELTTRADAVRRLPTFVFQSMWRSILSDLTWRTPKGVMAARFHMGLAVAIAEMARMLFLRENHRLAPKVALSGGSFQNHLLFELVERALREQGLEVLSHGETPPNDGGLSLGQAAIASARLLSSSLLGNITPSLSKESR